MFTLCEVLELWDYSINTNVGLRLMSHLRHFHYPQCENINQVERRNKNQKDNYAPNSSIWTDKYINTMIKMVTVMYKKLGDFNPLSSCPF